jgi:hypothetical protein
MANLISGGGQEWRAPMAPGDHRALTALICTHITPHAGEPNLNIKENRAGLSKSRDARRRKGIDAAGSIAPR